MSTGLVLQRRRWLEYNNDPQRRCYNGAHFSTAFRWTEWETLEYIAEGTDQAVIDDKLKFWRDLNDYAISQRGESARCEFEVMSADYRR